MLPNKWQRHCAFGAAFRRLHPLWRCAKRYATGTLRTLYLAVFLIGGKSTLGAQEIEWPELPSSGFLYGRAAITADVDSGMAVFTLKINGKYVGEPIDIRIPQYAFRIDEETGVESPVIIVQAETTGEVSVVGFLTVGEEGNGVALFREFRLLGTELP